MEYQNASLDRNTTLVTGRLVTTQSHTLPKGFVCGEINIETDTADVDGTTFSAGTKLQFPEMKSWQYPTFDIDALAATTVVTYWYIIKS